MKYSTRAEVELIGNVGALALDGIFENNEPYKLSRILSSFWICTKPTGADIAELLMKDGFWESWITLWMSKNVTPGSVCIDAGANYGYFTFFLANHGCKVYAIEANNELIKYLQKSVEVNGCEGRVYVMNKAVTDRSWQTVYLNIKDDIGGSTILNVETGKKTPVDTIALNDLMLLEKRVDFIKMDIEGAEEIAWEGIEKLMKNNPNCTVVIEFTPVAYKNYGRDFYNELNSSYNLSFIDFDGLDKPIIGYEMFEKNLNEFHMVVIRNK